MNIAFTICAKNYLGLAQVLESSFRKHNQNFDFYIIVADEFEVGNSELSENVLVARKIFENQISETEWNELAFKYNLTEFCTSIKPLCFQYLFYEKFGEKVFYFDPDILFFSSIDQLVSNLDTYLVLLTPHIVKLKSKYLGDRPELGILSTGVFNLGFLGLKKSIQNDNMIKWWWTRLKEYCFIDPLEGSFTDQRWMDFLPCFYDQTELLILKDLGLNLAPWNFFERKIYQKSENQFWVGSREDIDYCDLDELKFVHFSGYNYKAVISGDFLQNNISELKIYDDLNPIFEIYKAALNTNKLNILNFIELKYSYNFFENNIIITSLHRRLFRSFILKSSVVLNPFSVSKGSFFSLLKDARLINSKNSIDDKINKGNLGGISQKMKKINFLMRMVLRFLGVERYTLLIRFFRPYSRFENQIFLIDKNQNPL